MCEDGAHYLFGSDSMSWSPACKDGANLQARRLVAVGVVVLISIFHALSFVSVKLDIMCITLSMLQNSISRTRMLCGPKPLRLLPALHFVSRPDFAFNPLQKLI